MKDISLHCMKGRLGLHSSAPCETFFPVQVVLLQDLFDVSALSFPSPSAQFSYSFLPTRTLKMKQKKALGCEALLQV
uniref:Kinesin-like protein n=1 Tax=Rhizophora mucronata TaxID=61149 RepID=A0A2P2Q5N9_RHIMU